MFVKIIARKDTSEISNAHYGPNETELSTGSIMIANQNKTADVESIIFAHPTLSEAIMKR